MVAVRAVLVTLTALSLAACNGLWSEERIFDAGDFSQVEGLGGVYEFIGQDPGDDEAAFLIVDELASGRYRLSLWTEEGGEDDEAEFSPPFNAGLVPVGGKVYLAVITPPQDLGMLRAETPYDWLGGEFYMVAYVEPFSVEFRNFEVGGDDDRFQAYQSIAKAHGIVLRQETESYSHDIYVVGRPGVAAMTAFLREAIAADLLDSEALPFVRRN